LSDLARQQPTDAQAVKRQWSKLKMDRDRPAESPFSWWMSLSSGTTASRNSASGKPTLLFVVKRKSPSSGTLKQG
jgi:hypothetical protein